jgi:hypothetical protein
MNQITGLTAVLVASLFAVSCSSMQSGNGSTIELASDPVAGPPARLFLQQVTSHSAIIKWRGKAEQACVWLSKDKPRCQPAVQTATNHREVLFDQLQADSRYYYSVAGYADQTMQFTTAPETGTLADGDMLRVWILGDSGTASSVNRKGKPRHVGEAKAVMDGFVQFNQQQADSSLDMLLLLGDNAYVEGTDQQWQTAVFDLYRPILAGTAVWPTIGNHEMGTGAIDVPGKGRLSFGGVSISSSPDSFYSSDNPTVRRMPYLDIFSLPTRGEAGGVPSGTEQYYAFDYGNLHIVSLDSQLSARDENQRKAMRDWLIADLGNNQQDWTVVIFHHPPYTKGSHDSDLAAVDGFGIDQPIITMREEFTQLFEDYGVDMVYSGHSHSYERSYYLHGHRGDAASFNASQHSELNAAGLPASGRAGETYRQRSASSQLDDKVVYTVAGSSGKVSLGKGKLDHPAHAVQPRDAEQRHGLAELGSVLVEASRTRLTARFIDSQGQVLDDVTITRE